MRERRRPERILEDASDRAMGLYERAIAAETAEVDELLAAYDAAYRDPMPPPPAAPSMRVRAQHVALGLAAWVLLALVLGPLFYRVAAAILRGMP